MKNIKKKMKLIIFLLLPLMLSSCFGDSLLGLNGYTDLVCGFNPDSDHCFQSLAIQNGDTEGCSKIKGERFKSQGSNPPRDKCYLLIAEKTGDLNACNNIKGGVGSYTKQECLISTTKKFNTPDGCLKLEGKNKSDCISRVGPKLQVGELVDMDKQIEFLKEELKKGEDEELTKQLNGLEKRRENFLEVLPEDKKLTYRDLSDPLNKEIRLGGYLGEIDEKSKKSLLELNKLALDRGETIPRKEYETIRDMLVFKNDPKNDIENMDPNEMVKLRRDEKISKGKEYLKFWKASKTEKEEKLDESLLMYKRMLERQDAIDKQLTQKQQDFKREYDKLKTKGQNAILDKAKDEAKKYAFGEALDLIDSPAEGPTTAILGEAINVVKEHAQSSMFRGVVGAYNNGMKEELAKYKGNIEKAHAAVVKNLEDDPYRYENYDNGITFAKYGNLIENKECSGKNKNPLCLNKTVFWKSMKKSYKYQNK